MKLISSLNITYDLVNKFAWDFDRNKIRGKSESCVRIFEKYGWKPEMEDFGGKDDSNPSYKFINKLSKKQLIDLYIDLLNNIKND